MNILCFGDSNTWGYKPDKSGRYDENIRWTGLLQKKLGSGYHIIEEGLCGRTTVFQDELREGRREDVRPCIVCKIESITSSVTSSALAKSSVVTSM